MSSVEQPAHASIEPAGDNRSAVSAEELERATQRARELMTQPPQMRAVEITERNTGVDQRLFAEIGFVDESVSQIPDA